MLENHQLRYNAKQQLGGGIFRSAWLNMLCVCTITPLLSGVFTSTDVDYVHWIGLVVMFLATGALLSTVSSGQGESIPCIAHAVSVERLD